jgi:hypothetical protein
LLLLGLTALSGCAKSTGDVSGTVTFKGQPVTAGGITFYGAGGWAGSSNISPEGAYRIDKVPVGEVKVAVVSSQPKAGKPSSKATPEHPKAAGEAKAPAGKPVALPPKYKDPEQSGLSYDIKAGAQTIDIPLLP